MWIWSPQYNLVLFVSSIENINSFTLEIYEYAG